MKVERVRIIEILSKIWLVSANKIKPFESICKQSSQTQVIIVTSMQLSQLMFGFIYNEKYLLT